MLPLKSDHVNEIIMYFSPEIQLTAVIKLVTKKITILFYDVNKQLFSFKNQENGTMKLNSVSAKKLRGAPEFHTVIHV